MATGYATLAGIRLALAASGIYALMSLTVAQRTREIGIRAALGAQRRSLWLVIARRLLAQLGAGAALGTAVAGYFLFTFERYGDIATAHSAFALALLLGVGILLLVGLLACTVPTLRTLRILPAEALKDG